MNYNEIIKPYLIDFDKLEVGQTLWSVEFGNVEVKIATKMKGTEKIVAKITERRSFVGNFNNHLFFNANPFENLQRVEPLEMKCDVKNAIELLEKEGYTVLNLQNYNKNRIDYQSNPYPAELG